MLFTSLLLLVYLMLPTFLLMTTFLLLQLFLSAGDLADPAVPALAGVLKV
jgi:hypothetical protein